MSRRILAMVLAMGLGCMAGRAQSDAPPPPADIQLRAFVEATRVPLDNRVVYHIELSWTGDMARFQFVSIPQPGLTNLLPEGSGSTVRLEDAGDGAVRSVKTITYRLRPLDTGHAGIDGVEIRFRDTATGAVDALRAAPVALTILAAGSGATHLTALIYVVLLGIFAAAILYFSVQFLRRRRSQGAGSDADSLPDRYQRRLAQEIDPKSGNLNEAALRLLALFRDYLAERYALPAEADGPASAAHLAAAGMSPRDSDQAATLLERREIIRFGGTKLDPNEFQLIYGAVERFILDHDRTAEQMKEI